MRNQYITKNRSETKRLGEKIAKKILRAGPKKKAMILALEGDLGGGKTTFLQGFAKGLGIKEKILSPTFVILKRFKVPLGVVSCSHLCNFVYFYHVDCYRIEKPKEILDLGFQKIISDSTNIVAIEWAERVKKIIPETAIKIKFALIDKNTRKIIIKT